jgi:Fe-S cluster assembly protein SufB
MLDWRLEAFAKWLEDAEPGSGPVHYPKIDYQSISYFSAPKREDSPRASTRWIPVLLETYEKLGIPIEEQKALAGVAVDAVFDSVSVATTFRDKLAEAGVIFCSISEAVQEHPELVQKYLGTVVPPTDNFYAGLNSAVFTDGTFVYVPKNTRCPMELSTYFRINEQQHRPVRAHADRRRRGQLRQLPGGLHRAAARREPAPRRRGRADRHGGRRDQVLHRAELVSRRQGGPGGIYNFVTKRGDCRGDRSKISWTQVETGSAITWKYPSCILRGDDSVGEFYSVAVTKGASRRTPAPR